MMGEPYEPDPRFDVTEVVNAAGRVVYRLQQCRHVDVVPVESSGEVVAHLCLVCDAQLP
jgi:hypothetical protein